METSNFSGKSSCSKSSPWLRLENGLTPWEEFSPSERQEIVRHYAPKIKFMALRLKAKLPASVELQELMSAGSLGLMEALGRFNPEMKVKFETYAESRIKGAMLDDLRRLDWFSRGLRSRVRLLEEIIRKHESSTGLHPSVEELVKQSGLNEVEVREGLEALQNHMYVSLDAIVDNLAYFKRSDFENEPLQAAAFKEIIDKLTELIDELTPREKLVLSLYYTEELNMKEASQVMGITEGRISQLHSQALNKLRIKFQARHGLGVI